MNKFLCIFPPKVKYEPAASFHETFIDHPELQIIPGGISVSTIIKWVLIYLPKSQSAHFISNVELSRPVEVEYCVERSRMSKVSK